MRVVQSDERDVSWESHHPVFRVYFHSSSLQRTAGPTATYDVSGADLLQVIDWAQSHGGDRFTFAIALLTLSNYCDRGLVWLVGVDGNDEGHREALLSNQTRMLSRRKHPVKIPVADKSPVPHDPAIPKILAIDIDE